MNFIIVCDVMADLEGFIRPAIYLADWLVKGGYKVTVVSPYMSKGVERHLTSTGINFINLGAKLFFKNFGKSLLFFESWGREAFFRLNSRLTNGLPVATVNFSQTLSIPSIFWYLQGPTSSALKDIENELAAAYSLTYKTFHFVIEHVDIKLVKDLYLKSSFVVANSKFCASLYEKLGVRVDEVIYPPVDSNIFRPSTRKPSENYVLTYFGKETKFSVVKAIADLGVKIKAFGFKAPFIPNSLTNHVNIEFLGEISSEDLVDAYSNALFTIFPFTHEPFGYIPVESMACGTPVLTYNIQGPSESVVDGVTGWLVKGDYELIRKALEIWKDKYDCGIRENCIETAAKFSVENYVKNWMRLFSTCIEQSSYIVVERGRH
ncbi:MAG: glycosyltransferase family 4 protein [Candidatus Bathyarchaeia archaeon]